MPVHQANSDGEVVVPLSKVPAVVLSAAQKEVPGIVLARAEREVEGGVVVYDLEGKTADGTEYEIEVTAAGKVLEVEEEDDDDDDDEDDDDDDHDGDDDDD